MSALLELIHAEASRIGAMVTSSRWYLFGSLLKDKRPVSDIDLLVVCATAGDCSAVRLELGAACSEYPIHLLLMTFDEEGEVKFIQGQDAVPLDRVSI
jgi:predicted nucleotidyltransferase